MKANEKSYEIRQMSKEYGQKYMPDMRKLQASNTQTSDAAWFFFGKK